MKIENIKFKAKRLDGKGWACGYFYEENGNIYIIENRQKESMLNRNITYQVDPSTVCQFTGLKDCEGKEIWEGDILEGESKSEVVYTKVTFTISFIGYNKRVFTYPLCYYIKEDGTIDGKVIGNKFDKEK